MLATKTKKRFKQVRYTKEKIFAELDVARRERDYYISHAKKATDPGARKIMIDLWLQLNDEIDRLLDELNLIIKKGEDRK